MFNYHNRQYVFKQSNGELWNFYCDSRHTLCYSTLSRRGVWSNPVMLHKNLHPFFTADMDQEDRIHILFQDNNGNLNYSRLDGQSLKTIPVLSAKNPNVYNKQLFIAPFADSIYFFYVLQHENSFMLASQILANNKVGSPKVVDYVSGSSLPCTILYDSSQNLYAFFQSYDGKYLQLGYKKLNAQQKNWSDFTPITKYAGNCEYPHAICDDSGTIHLCYQRRAPKLFEMVYQQKSPEKNLWTPEVAIHTSVHSFENTSIVKVDGNIVVYWVRDEAIYYNTGAQAGSVWGKPSRLSFFNGSPLQCLSYKSNSAADRAGDSHSENVAILPPNIFPGILSNGLKLAFNTPVNTVNTGDVSRRAADGRNNDTDAGGDVKTLVLDTFKQIQGSIDEVQEGLTTTRNELAKLSGTYSDLVKEMGKYSIRLNMLENYLGQVKKLGSRLDILSLEVNQMKTAGQTEETKKSPNAAIGPESDESRSSQENSPVNPVEKSAATTAPKEAETERKSGSSLDTEQLKKWEEWKEPEEWM